MQFAFDIASLGIGLLIGAGFALLLMRTAAARAEDRARAAGEAERAGLAARLDFADRQLAELRDEAVERDGLVADLRRELGRETSDRVQAQERAARIPDLEAEVSNARTELSDLKAHKAQLELALEQERASGAEKLALIEQAQIRLSDAFKALSSEALRHNNQSFLELARSTLEKYQESARGDLDRRQTAIADLVTPVKLSLEKIDGQIQELEKTRVGAYEGLRQQVLSLVETQRDLRSETSNLVRALRSPVARGRWGEIQLKRVVEMAGMLDHCDFYEQTTVTGESGRLRPDMLVKLPGGKSLVIDAKTPLEAFLDVAQATDDDTRRLALTRHARHVREHMKQLGAKAYWDQFGSESPEFVVLFLPGEHFFSAALEEDPALIEAGIDHRVIPATPTTLIALLRAVAYGWRQERLEENAREISALGAELYKRLGDLGGHMDKLGDRLGKAVASYNGAVGSLESRVLVTARRFRDLHAASGQTEIRELQPLDHLPRRIQAPELHAPTGAPDGLPARPNGHAVDGKDGLADGKDGADGTPVG